MEVFDKGAVAISISSLAIYHIYTYSSVFCLHNENIQLSRNLSNSFFWIQKHRAYADAASTTLAGMLYYLISTSAQWTLTLHTAIDTNDFSSVNSRYNSLLVYHFLQFKHWGIRYWSLSLWVDLPFNMAFYFWIHPLSWWKIKYEQWFFQFFYFQAFSVGLIQ